MKLPNEYQTALISTRLAITLLEVVRESFKYCSYSNNSTLGLSFLHAIELAQASERLLTKQIEGMRDEY